MHVVKLLQYTCKKCEKYHVRAQPCLKPNPAFSDNQTNVKISMCSVIRICHAKSPMALFSMFIYIMHGTFAIPECESTLHHLNFRSLKQEEFEGALLHAINRVGKKIIDKNLTDILV